MTKSVLLSYSDNGELHKNVKILCAITGQTIGSFIEGAIKKEYNHIANTLNNPLIKNI